MASKAATAQPIRRKETCCAAERVEDGRRALDVAVAEFMAECKRRGHTPATQSIYRSALLGPRMEMFRRDHSIDKVVDFTGPHLRQFETELQEAELSPSTVHQYHRTVKTFLGFCEREGMNVDERVHDVMAPRLPQVEPEAYTLDEQRRLLAAARTRAIT